MAEKQIDWEKTNILRINNEIRCFDSGDVKDKKPDSLRKLIEPWLTAIFQSEYFSLLLGTGLTSSLAVLQGIEKQDMLRIDFNQFKEEIKESANQSAKKSDRGSANLEDDFRTAFELLRGLEIQKSDEAANLSKEINSKLLAFIKKVIKTESNFYSIDHAEALKVLKSFLISFSSRAASRERTNIFTTNYDRFIEYGLDQAGILTLDRFVGKIKPIFRATKLDLDYHYNPPGIRGEPRYVEGVVRYTKLHGSVDWIFDKSRIVKVPLEFGCAENNPLLSEKPIDYTVIYPNSSKGIDTAYFPYSELFRDFSSAVCRPNSVIVTYGYGFGDTHINRIIKDMLTLPSTHLVIISYDAASGRISKFYNENNPAQITLVIGKDLADLKPLVDNYLPKAAIDRIQERQSRLEEKRRIPGKDESLQNDVGDNNVPEF